MTSDIAALMLTLGLNGLLMSRERIVEIWNLLNSTPNVRCAPIQLPIVKTHFVS